MGTLHFYSNPPMDEYPRQTTSTKPFSKGLTKYEEVGGGGRKGLCKGFQQKSEVVHTYIHTCFLFGVVYQLLPNN